MGLAFTFGGHHHRHGSSYYRCHGEQPSSATSWARLQWAGLRGALHRAQCSHSPPHPRLPKHGPSCTQHTCPRKGSREVGKFPALRSSALVMPFTSHPLAQAPAMTPCGTSPSPVPGDPLWGSQCKGFGGRWEKLCFHSFVPPPTAKVNLWFNCPGTFVSRLGFWVNTSLCYSREASCGPYLPRIHARGGGAVGRGLGTFSFPCSHPSPQAPGVKCCNACCPGRGQASFLSLKPA